MLKIYCADEQGQDQTASSICTYGDVLPTISFGVPGKVTTKSFPHTGAIPCSPFVFDGTDPAPGQLKQCYINEATPALAKCCGENQICSIGKEATIWYGYDDTFIKKKFNAGNVTCNGQSFGNKDPYLGKPKSCYIEASMVAPDQSQSQVPSASAVLNGPISESSNEYLYIGAGITAVIVLIIIIYLMA